MIVNTGDVILGLIKLSDDIEKFRKECLDNGYEEVDTPMREARNRLYNLAKEVHNSRPKDILVSSTVRSDSFDEMVQKDFTYKGKHYTWNDSDCLYYNDNGDEDDYFMEIPEGAITSSKTIKSDYSDEEYWYPETKKSYHVWKTGHGRGWRDLNKNDGGYSTKEEAENFMEGIKERGARYEIREHEDVIESSKEIKSGYYDTKDHPEGGGTCDNCQGEVEPGDGYEADFESAREIAQEALVDAFKLGNVNLYSYEEKQRFIDFLDMEDEDEFDSAISEICNMAFEGKSYQCPDCAKENIYQAAREWVADNYDTDDEIESSVIKSAKSEAGYTAHEIMTFPEFQNIVKGIVEPVEMFEYKAAYFVILSNEEDCKKLNDKLVNTYGVGQCVYYKLEDPYNKNKDKWQLMA